MDNKTYIRKNEYDDVYVPSNEPVYEPELTPSYRSPTPGGKRVAAGMLAFVLLASSTGITYGNIANTGSFFKDDETSVGNSLTANILDFTNPTPTAAFDITLGPVQVPVGITPEVGSVEMNYRVTAEFTAGSQPFCDALNVTLATPFAYDSDLLALDGLAFVTPSLDMQMTLPADSGMAQGDQCVFDVVFHGWNKLVPESTGYTDEERVTVTATYIAPIEIELDLIESFSAPAENPPEDLPPTDPEPVPEPEPEPEEPPTEELPPTETP